ncbi:MAG TPA: NAD(P)/FAD-dependent oxidoreductase [Gaiellaceae bacterium]|nr:NAD(P)/FAD-dependent oxidoreductase [Gaiellaceae bacterium]
MQRAPRQSSVVIVGAGPAGLAVSSRLARTGVPHVVLERHQVGWTWRAQRWDSFRLNTPLWATRVPGKGIRGRAESFPSPVSLVSALDRLARRLPVAEGVEVFAARRSGPGWRLHTSHGLIAADAVVVASGFQNVPRMPAYASELPERIQQLHVAGYRAPRQVGDAVLVVGGGQSGVQIAEDLLDAGKRVYVATSRVGRMPRRFAGRDAFEWMLETGQLDVRRDDADPAAIGVATPQVSGVGGGRTVSYQALAARGATLLGRVRGWNGGALELAGDLGDNVRFADDVSSLFRATWEKRARLRGAAPVVDPADEPAPQLYGVAGPRSLDLVGHGIGTVIWATGFGPSTGWLPTGALDSRRRPQLPGLHVVGAPWLTHRSSANLYGMAADADRLVSTLTRQPARIAA